MLKSRIYIPLLILFMAGLTLVEPVLANKFETIGGGVSGMSHEKYQMLQNVAGGAGLFFILLGLISLVPQLRGASELKVPEVTGATSVFLFVVAGILLLIYSI
jgi:hypothetical protein